MNGEQFDKWFDYALIALCILAWYMLVQASV